MHSKNVGSSGVVAGQAVRLSAIGDTCHALAVIRRLQDNWPDARITWIIGRTEAGLMADSLRQDIRAYALVVNQGLHFRQEGRNDTAIHASSG